MHEHTNNTRAPSPSDVLTVEQCAEWLGVSLAWLERDSHKERPVVPVVRVGLQRRYHRRTVEVELMRRAFVPLPLIAASFGENSQAA